MIILLNKAIFILLNYNKGTILNSIFHLVCGRAGGANASDYKHLPIIA